MAHVRHNYIQKEAHMEADAELLVRNLWDTSVDLSLFVTLICSLIQGSPKYGPRAGPGPLRLLIGPATLSR